MSNSPTHTRSGQCLCGAVHFTAHETPDEVSICHCSMCRRWIGGPAFAVHAKGDVVFDSGEDSVGWYNSSDWAMRGFCKTCGTSLFYRIKGEQPEWIIQAGALNDGSAHALASEIFVDEKPAFYAFEGERPRLTGAEVFALFAPPSDPDVSGS